MRRSLLTACKEIANITPISSPTRAILGTNPEVDNVIRRFEKESPILSLAIDKDFFTLSKLQRGSPIPIITILEILRPTDGITIPSISSHPGKSPRRLRAKRTCSNISSAVRLRTNF
ncbi:hypothetical protein FXW25_04870 [Candidatus Liberibacter asiaticus]|nr:hypothetical protein FXW25_04870 [Candidatus Liberibacter asiaticus]